MDRAVLTHLVLFAVGICVGGLVVYVRYLILHDVQVMHRVVRDTMFHKCHGVQCPHCGADASKLMVLARWFSQYCTGPNTSSEVQDDLKEWANRILRKAGWSPV